MSTHGDPNDGDDRKTARRGGFFPLAPGLLHDARMSGLTWRQRYLFITLLANAWRGADRNGRLVPGQVIRPLPELAADLGIRVDHVRADLTRLTARGLVTLDGGSVLVADFEGWHGLSAASAERTVGSQHRDPDSQNGEFDSQNGNPAPQNGVIDSQNGETDSRNGVEDSQNGVTEVPSAQQAQGFVPSVRCCSDVRSENLSEESSSDVPAAAVAAPVTSTAGDDDLNWFRTRTTTETTTTTATASLRATTLGSHPRLPSGAGPSLARVPDGGTTPRLPPQPMTRLMSSRSRTCCVGPGSTPPWPGGTAPSSPPARPRT